MDVRVDHCVLDPAYYPRVNTKPDWQTVAKYAAAMKNGSEFPPIEIVKGDDGKYIALCGITRLAAARQNKYETIAAVLLKGLRKSEWFFYAAKDNAKHGRNASMQDRCLIADRLQREGRDAKMIAECIQVAAEKIGEWAQRVRQGDNGETVVAKAATLPAMETRNERVALQYSGPLANASVRRTLDEMLGLLNGKLVNVEEPAIRERAEKIREHLDGLLKRKAAKA
jgi:hypothetical protein